MNVVPSSIHNLKEALNHITTGENPILSKHAGFLANSLEGVNSELSQGWRTAEELCKKICLAVTGIVDELHSDVHKYIDGIYQAEITAKAAVDGANDVATDILENLKELGLVS